MAKKMEVASGIGGFGKLFWLICCTSKGRYKPKLVLRDTTGQPIPELYKITDK